MMDKSWARAPLSMNLLVDGGAALDNTELGKY